MAEDRLHHALADARKVTWWKDISDSTALAEWHSTKRRNHRRA